MKNKLTVELKIEDDLMKRMAFVAREEGRSVNNQLLYLIRQNIAYYERVHGKIKPADLEKIEISGPEKAED